MTRLSRSGDSTSRPARSPTPADRWLAHRRRSFVRDWILALIALGLVIAASAIRSDRDDPEAPPPEAAGAAT